MTDVTLTDTQAKAVAAIKDWFENRTEEQQVFRVFGYAGTGKTTITKYAIGELGLNMEGLNPDVRFAAFTGKAAHVMRKHGTPAKTIHSLIYCVTEATELEINQARERVEKLKAGLISIEDRTEKLMAMAAIEAAEQEIKKMKMPRFGLNPESPVVESQLIVLDEVSMVGQDLAKDLLSFGKPILVLGDPGQLPPIKGEGAFTQQTPDVMLTEIHRQAEESAIIRLATMARQGIVIPYGRHDDHVYKVSKLDVTPQNLLRGGQVICGRNSTRFELNNAMRRAAGFDHTNPLPSGPGEKIICLKNDSKRGLINGMFLELSDIRPDEDPRRLRFKARATDEDGNEIVEVTDEGGMRHNHWVYSGHFLDHHTFDADRHDRDWKLKKGMVEATFGWAITCHKAQGSQWENIMVWDDGLGRTAVDRNRWMYTAITRAERGLVILD